MNVNLPGFIPALDRNPFDPHDEPDRYRRWEAASAVHSGPAVLRTVLVAAGGLPAARQRHAVAEGIEQHHRDSFREGES